MVAILGGLTGQAAQTAEIRRDGDRCTIAWPHIGVYCRLRGGYILTEIYSPQYVWPSAGSPTSTAPDVAQGLNRIINLGQ